MHWYIGPVYAFILTIVCMVPLRALARSRRMVDDPGGRKAHSGRVPLVGGVAMFLGLAWGIKAGLFIDLKWGVFLLSAGLLVTTGVLDDVFDLRVSLRLFVYLLTGLAMTLLGGQAFYSLGDPFFLGVIDLGLLAVPFTILVMMTVVNAYNMIDGVDGLAGGSALVALIAMELLAVVRGAYPALHMLPIVIATVVGFLVYNMPLGINARLRTFMGDAGSMLLGFAIVFFGIELTQGEGAVASPVAMLWLIALPVQDMFCTLFYRVSIGRAPWAPGRDHVHHLMQEIGLTPRQGLVLLLAVNTLFALIGLSGPLLGVADGWLFGLWLFFLYLNFAVLRRTSLTSRMFRRLIAMQA